MSGIVTPCPPGMPGAALPGGVPFPRLALETGPDLDVPRDNDPLSQPPVPTSVTVRAALDRDVFGDRSYAAVKKALQRAEKDGYAPEPTRRGSVGGRAHEYDLTDLIAFAKEIDR